MKLQRTFTAAMASAVFLLSPTLVAAQQGQGSQPVFVRTLVVSEPDATATRQFFGRVRARDTLDLAFEVGGRLSFLDAVEGVPVLAGTLIAELDIDPFERAVARAEVTLAQAERDLDRARQLAVRNVASSVNAEMAETARDLAALTLRDANAALEDARIVAPFDGLIADRISSNGTIVEPGQPVVRLHDMSEFRVDIELPERLVSELADLDRIGFTALLPGGEVYPLTFRELRAETGPVGQSYTMSLAASDDRLPRLLPGQTVIVRAAVPHPDPRPAVPATAIATAPDGAAYVVAVEARGGDLYARHIGVEVVSPTGTTLVVEGLPEETEIVAIGAYSVPDGSPLARYAGLVRGAE